MYAIVNTGGKQYKVATDDVITVEKIEGNEGDKVTLPVIFLNDGKRSSPIPTSWPRPRLPLRSLSSSRARSSWSSSSTSVSAIVV